MAAGGELIIDDKLVRAIHDMEKALQGVTKEADATQRKTMAWLSSLNSGNIDAFTNKIKQLESNYMNLVNALSNVKGFENLSEKALNTAGAITQLITVMGQNTPKKTDGFDSIRQTLDSLLAQLAKARQDIDLYYQAIGTGKKEYIEFGQTGLKEAEARAESLMRKIEALNTTYQQLKQSSFNITDLTKGTMDDERNRIELSGIKMRLQEEERVHKAVMEHNLEELKAINDKIEAGIQGEKALAKAEEERHRKRQEYYNNVGRQWDIDDKAIRDANMAELKAISDKVENAKRAEKEAVESAKREHDAKQKYYEDFGKIIEEEEKRKKQANTDYYNWEMEQLAKEVKAAQDAANKKLQAEQEYAAKRKELQAMYTSLWNRNEADMMSARVAQRTNGQTWNVDANEVIRRTQEELAQRRQYIAERTAMYERMFEEIERKEKKVQDDIRNYEQQKQNESLAKYKQQKEEQARVDKYYHDKRQREYDEMFKAIERNENRQRAINAKYGDSSKGALNYSNRLYSTNGVRSIQNMETALNKLRDAQRRLNVGTEEGRKRYAELGAQIKKIEGDLNRVTNASERMKKSHSGLINTGQQLARQLALVFSVSQIEGYANKLVSVRKEFEMQQRSLQVLLRDKDEANQLWNQTIQLAVQSPFRVKELVTYTKQLAAYRIESEKLHDTTKMLADVSAGLGVDMNRLILAFGQVKAASFLRGCLGYGTKIRTLDGIKEVQDIKVGDKLINENNEIVNVKELIRGKEQMYIVHQSNGDDYRCNENHILTLYKNGDICDVYLKDIDSSFLGVRYQNGHLITYEISIEKDSVDDYYGFVLDGNKRFQLGDGTITHNTELRQFTEAGIPMLEELADHFTELEGRAVSTADVFARISKRMVTFEDVEQVFKKVTSEGGTFYRMQEEQSKTLYGMISNLHDSLDLMMNDIGQSNESVLKGAVELTKTLVDNWRAVASVMEVIGTSLAIKGLTLFVRGFRAASAHALLATTNFRGLALAGAKVNGAMKAIHTTLMAHPWYAVAAAVLIATKGLYDYNKSIQQHNKKYDDLSKLELSRIDRLKEIREEVEKNNATIKDNKSKQEELNQAQLANAKVLEELKKKFPDLYDGLVQQKNGTIELSDAIEAQNALLQINIALQQASKGGWFQQDMETNYTQVYEAQKKMEDSLGKIKIAASNVRLELLNMLREKSVPQNIASPIQKLVEEIGDSEDLDYATSKWKELNIYLQSIYTQGYRLGNLKWDLGGAFVSANKNIVEYDNALKDLYDNLDNGMVRFKEGVEWALSMGGNEAATKWLNTMLMSLGIVDEKIKKEAREYITSKINIKLEFGDDKKEYTEDDLNEEWKKKVWNAIKAVQEANPEIALGITLKTMVEGDKSSIIPKLQESVKNAIDVTTKDLKGADLDGQVVFTDDQMDKMEKTIPLLENLANLIALVRDTKGSGGDKKDWFAEMGRAIRDTHKDFHTLHKDLDVASATYFALAKNADVFDEAAKNAGVNMSLSDFEDLIKEESVLDALDALLQSIPESASVSRLAIKKMIGEITGDDAVHEMQETAEKLNSQIEDMFGTYELSLELKDMNIPTDIAEKLFGFESLDLEGLKEKLKELEPQFIGTDREKKYRDYLQKVEEMEAKALEERMKKYAKFLEQEQTERVKIKLNEVRQLMEIEDTFRIHEKDAREKFGMTNDQWKLYEVQRKKGEEINLEFLKGLGIEEEKAQAILEQNRLLTEQKHLAYAGVNRTTQEQLDKDTWESFKKSGYYEMMFGDLEHLGSKAIDSLHEKLSNMQDALKQLPPEVYKEIQSTIDKVESIKLERNPFEALRDAWKEVRDLNKNGIEIDIADPFFGVSAGTKNVKGEEEIAEEYARQEARLTQLREEEAIVAAVLAVKQGTATIDQQQLTQTQEAQGYLDKQESDLNVILKGKQKEKKLTEQNTKKLKEGVDEYQEMSEAVSAPWKKTEQWAEAIKNTADATDALLDSLGVAEDSATRIAVQAVSMTADMIVNVVQLQVQFKAAGIEANTMLGIIGWIAMALQAVAKIFTFIFGLHDARLQKQIENIEADVESLQKSLERLEEQMEEVYSIGSIMFTYDRSQSNIEDQIEGYRKMIELEKEKKKTDIEKIKEYNEEIENLQEKQKELEINRNKEVGGFGGAQDYKEVSTAFVEAWMDAFKETGDGLSGLEEQFNEYFVNMVKKQLLGRGVESIMTNFYEEWNNMLRDGYMDDTEIDKSRGLMEEYGIRLNDYLTSATNALGLSADLLGGNAELGTLQKGIQGITEDQADILASYLNSIRFIIGEHTGYLKKIVDNYNNTDTANPMLGQLQLIANQTTAIHDLLDSVTRAGHKDGGYGIKVFTN